MIFARRYTSKVPASVVGQKYFGPGAGAGPFHHYVFGFSALDAKLDLPGDRDARATACRDGTHVIGKAAYFGRFINKRQKEMCMKTIRLLLAVTLILAVVGSVIVAQAPPAVAAPRAPARGQAVLPVVALPAAVLAVAVVVDRVVVAAVAESPHSSSSPSMAMKMAP